MVSIPKDWSLGRLENVCLQIRSGGTPLTTVPGYWGGSIPWAVIADITSSGKFLTRTATSITGLGLASSAASLFPENTILYSMYASLGQVCITQIPVATNQAILGIIPNENIVTTPYLYYALSSLKTEVMSQRQTGTQSNLSANIVKKIQILIPPHPEQRAIAEVLSTFDEHLASLDALIEKKTAFFSDLLNSIDVGNDFSKEQHIIGKLGSYADVKVGPFGSMLHKSDYVSVGTPIVTVEHLGERNFSKENLPFVSSKDWVRLKNYTLRPGDIVFSRVGSIDRSTFVDSENNGWLFSGRCLRVRVISNLILPIYLYYLLNTVRIKSYLAAVAVGGTMPCLNTKLLLEVPLMFIKDVDEQRMIAEALEDVRAELDSLRAERAKVEMLKQAAMDDLLSGRVRLQVQEVCDAV